MTLAILLGYMLAGAAVDLLITLPLFSLLGAWAYYDPSKGPPPHPSVP